MINLVVVGGGEGTYKNLWPAIHSENPRLDMRIAAVIDILPLKDLNPKTQEIIAQENVVFLHPDELSKWKFNLLGNMAGIVMTPNDSHLWYTRFFASCGIPVYAEKPIVTSSSDLKSLLDMPEKNLRHVYGAEYCVDGKALAFLNAAGAICADDPRRVYLNASPDISIVYSQLGQLLSIHGKMLEGEGTAGTADHRAWLLEGIHGGMIRDLLSHLFGPLYEAGLVSSDVVNLRVKLGKYEVGMPLGVWRPLKSAIEGETYAAIKGNFLMPYGAPEFSFEVAKYWPRHERSLVLTFRHGRIEMSYEKPFKVTIETESSIATSTVTVDFYPTLALLDFKRFIEGKTHGHIGRAIAIARFNEQAREAGLEQEGI